MSPEPLPESGRWLEVRGASGDPPMAPQLWESDGGTIRYVAQYPEVHLGDYRPGRWAWLLEDITALDEPAPARGRQGLWNWERADG